ncbi:hypothetical protein BC937DRAFT_92767 [Endogone sp. FLAS-F59071]|nr:hypothetical protein BC937DRAFT_92767 [Endogone sp. FLAS-F59071]|eukprot:RUS21412.1 hypothetical protein BC937DRAFT_92767 [Endogone sp. FLAS-F59071]
MVEWRWECDATEASGLVIVYNNVLDRLFNLRETHNPNVYCLHTPAVHHRTLAAATPSSDALLHLSRGRTRAAPAPGAPRDTRRTIRGAHLTMHMRRASAAGGGEEYCEWESNVHVFEAPSRVTDDRRREMGFGPYSSA